MVLDFAVAIYLGHHPQLPLSKPVAWQLWSHFLASAGRGGRFSPPQLVEIELRLRTGRSWQDPEGEFSLFPLVAGSPVTLWVEQTLAAMEEMADATVH